MKNSRILAFAAMMAASVLQGMAQATPVGTL